MEKFSYVGTRTFNELPGHMKFYLLQNRLNFQTEEELQEYVYRINLSSTMY